MKRLTTGVAVVALAALAGTAWAGDYHNDGTLLCAQCHVMHFSTQHGYNVSQPNIFTPLSAGGPHEYLLRDEVNNLCLSCHDQNGIAPDVLGSMNTGKYPSDVRLGGYLNRLSVEGFEPTGHTLDSLAVAPGSTSSWKPEDDNGPGHGLNCTNCHHQHAYAGGPGNAYRNLQGAPGPTPFGTQYLVSYNDGDPGNNNLTRDVFQDNELSYDESDVFWNEPDETNSAIGEWCGACHDNFHGSPGDAQVGGMAAGGGGAFWDKFVRHPTAGVDIGDLGGGHSGLGFYQAATNKVKVMSASGMWDANAGADSTPTCISCHKAHGNGNAFGLIYRSGTGTLTEDGDSNGSQVEALCSQCHTQASFFAGP